MLKFISRRPLLSIGIVMAVMAAGCFTCHRTIGRRCCAEGRCPCRKGAEPEAGPEAPTEAAVSEDLT